MRKAVDEVSNVWVSSDFHISHQKLAEIRGFETKEEHNEYIVDMWNNTVRKDDVVYLLGDMSSGGKQSTLDSLEIMGKLPGRKRLIYGNHDAASPVYYKEQAKWFSLFSEVYELHTPFTFKRFGGRGRKVLLIHYPIWADHTEEPRHKEHRMPDWEGLRLHGHSHSPEKYTSDRELHVGLEAWDLQLVPYDTIESWVNSKESDD